MLDRTPVDRLPIADDRETGNLKFDSVSQAEAHALNAIYRPRSPVELSLPSGRLRIQIRWMAQHEINIVEPWTITCGASGRTFAFIVPKHLLELILAETDGMLKLSTLSSELRNLLIEYALTSAFTQIENAADCSLAITSIAPGHDLPATDNLLSASLHISLNDTLPMHCLAYLPHDKPRQVSDALALVAGNERRSACEPPFPVRIAWGNVELTLAELRTLAPGDIVLVDNSRLQPGLAVAVIGEHLVAPVEVLPTGYHLSRTPAKAGNSSFAWSVFDRSYRMTPAADAAMNELPVCVTFEFGSLMLERREMEKLAAGSMLELARPLEEGLEIRGDGLRIGLGELTAIGNTKGVRVKRLFNTL